MKPMYKRYENAKPVGVYGITNNFCMLVYEPDENDKYDCDYICAWSIVDVGTKGFHRHNVHYSMSNRPFIRKGNMRIYLDEIMRT